MPTNNNWLEENGNKWTTTSNRPTYGSIGYQQHDLKSAQDRFYGTKYRYLIGTLLMMCVTMACYSNATLYISSIEMISSDVLNSGITQLRAKHKASLDWLRVLPKKYENTYQDFSTCPLVTYKSDNEEDNHMELIEGLMLNISLILKMDAAALASETKAIVDDVNWRLKKGQLVDWTIKERGLLFSAGRVGFMLSALPVSRLGLHYGSKIVASLGILACAIHTLFFPVIAGHSPFWFTLIFEFICGCFSNAMLLVLYPLVACWFLPKEASTFVALSNVFALVGRTLNDFVSTQMLAQNIPWCWLFYLPGTLNAILYVAWLILAADRPEKSKYVTKEELVILEQSVTNINSKLGQVTNKIDPMECCICDEKEINCQARLTKRVPIWTKLATCPSVWMLIVANFSAQWISSSDSFLPTFFSNVLHWNPSTIGYIILSKGVCALIYGTIFAYITRKFAMERPFKMSLTAFRRSSQLMATLFDVLRLMLRILFDCDMLANGLSVMMFAIVNSFDVISYHQMPLDLSPEDSGLIVSWLHLFSFGDALSTPVAGWIISATTSADLPNGDRHAWRLVWLLCVIIKLIACVCFVTFARAEPRNYSRLKPLGVCKSRLLISEQLNLTQEDQNLRNDSAKSWSENETRQ